MSPPARALPATESESYDRWSRLVQRQFGAVLRMALGVVVGIELVGNRSQVAALGHWLGGRPVAVAWDLCAGWAQSDVLVAMVAIAIAIPTLAATIAQTPCLVGLGRTGDRDEQIDRVAAFRLMAGLAGAVACFAAVGAALACLQIVAVLAADTAWQGSCVASGASYVMILLAAVGVLLACLVVLPISGQLETQQFVRRAEAQRYEQQLERLPERLRRGRRWWRIAWWLVVVAVVTVASVIGLAWLIRPDEPVVAAALGLAPLVVPLILAGWLLAAVFAAFPAYATWWARSLDLRMLSRAMALLGWLAALVPVGVVIVGNPIGVVTLGPLDIHLGTMIMMLPIALVALGTLGIGRFGRGSGGLALVLVRKVLERKLAEARLGLDPEPAPRRGLEPGPDRHPPGGVALPRRGVMPGDTPRHT